ncbi:MAG: hypothetical protein WBA45_03370 [Microthrixaceae bacterium]
MDLEVGEILRGLPDVSVISGEPTQYRHRQRLELAKSAKELRSSASGSLRTAVKTGGLFMSWQSTTVEVRIPVTSEEGAAMERRRRRGLLVLLGSPIGVVVGLIGIYAWATSAPQSVGPSLALLAILGFGLVGAAIGCVLRISRVFLLTLRRGRVKLLAHPRFVEAVAERAAGRGGSGSALPVYPPIPNGYGWGGQNLPTPPNSELPKFRP